MENICKFKAVKSDSLIQNRLVKRYHAKQMIFNSDLDQHKITRIIPMSTLDGQALAGSGALVFEGELLNLPHWDQY